MLRQALAVIPRPRESSPAAHRSRQSSAAGWTGSGLAYLRRLGSRSIYLSRRGRAVCEEEEGSDCEFGGC